MDICVNCGDSFKFDRARGLIGQDKCLTCAAKAWAAFMEIVGAAK
jgi:hypothetical protein